MRRFNFDTPTASVDIPGWYEAEPGTADKYTVRGLIGHGDVCEVYDATGIDNEPIVLKVCRSAENNDLVENEFSVLTSARTSPQWIREGETKLPLPRESFHIGDNRRVNAFALTPGDGKPPLRNVATLSEVHIAYPSLDPRDAAWMFNRLIDSLHCLHVSGYVHGAVTPDHFIIEPSDHRGQLLDFGYAVKPGQKVTAISPDWRSIYAPEILVREPVSPATDIYMAARCMFYLMGISPTQAAIAPCPLPMFRFLRACLLGPKQRIQNTWQVHEDFRNILTELYGERKFRTFSMPTLSATT